MKILQCLCATGLSICILNMAGCASTPPAQFYSLSAIEPQMVGPASTRPKLSLSVGPISLPDFLDRPQIVTRTGTNTLQLAEFHRWIGSLQGEFERVICENLSILLDTDRIFLQRHRRSLAIDYNLILIVKHFEGSLGGDVILNADWILTDHRNEGEVIFENAVIRIDTTNTQYDELIAKQSEAVAILSRQIASAITNSP